MIIFGKNVLFGLMAILYLVLAMSQNIRYRNILMSKDSDPLNKFNGFKFYVDKEGKYDETTNAAINNMKALEAFYLAHRTYKHFIFPLHGLENVTCRFRTPLEIPEGLAGGGGVVAPFTIQLIEKP